MHRTPQNHRGCISFWHSNALIQEARILTSNNHSRSFTLQSVAGRQGVASPYNIAGLIAEDSEEVATYSNRQKLPSSSTPLSFDTPRRGTPANIPIHLILPETGIIGLHFCRWWYGSIFIQICAVGSKRRIFSSTECVLAVQGHPRSMILVPIESAYVTSYISH